MQRFPNNPFQGPNYRPRHPGNDGMFTHRARGYQDFHHFPDFHHEGPRFHGPRGRGNFHRGPRPPYRGGMGGRQDGFPMAAHGHGPPRFSGGGSGNPNAYEGQFSPPRFHQPTNHQNDYNNFNDRNRTGNPNFNAKRGRGRGRGGGRGARSGAGGREQQNSRKTKNKKSKPPKEINYSHYCDVCDRGFQSDEQLKVHIAEHVECKEKDCRFVGHPKVVKMHHKLQHGPGCKKIRWLDTAEDIEKWRNERKRNFPTAENIAKKQSKTEQRTKQGNVLETKKFGKFKKTHRGQRGQKSRERHRLKLAEKLRALGITLGDPKPNDSDETPPKRVKTDDGQEDKPSSAVEEQETKPAELSDPSSQSSSLSGTKQQGPEREVDCDPLSLLASKDNESGDDEAPETQVVVPKIEVAPKGTFGALGSLAACYDSDSEGSFVGEHAVTDAGTDAQSRGTNSLEDTSEKAPEQCPTEQGASETTPLHTELRQTAPPEDADPTSCHDDGRSEEKMDVGDGGREKRRRSSGGRDPKRQKRTQGGKRKRSEIETAQKKATLLEMLLAPDIRRERNIILQCVRHVVKKNFFQGSKT
ncbi:nuclear fragile X mental retardation-interacting protein 1-like isoform X2 [Lytechinus variegatus]|uniref:nuclear fragile X mental retardation-interacting protein 1-like isoform X2 n=1 Tax=Lytechinus variegatus TaxID=7654 RepID=UPI001BB1BA0A|nr:nuclear fragile X mental retardation-interacting protein 1-like isoform X2 [Lytechinus variegatus]